MAHDESCCYSNFLGLALIHDYHSYSLFMSFPLMLCYNTFTTTLNVVTYNVFERRKVNVSVSTVFVIVCVPNLAYDKDCLMFMFWPQTSFKSSEMIINSKNNEIHFIECSKAFLNL